MDKKLTKLGIFLSMFLCLSFFINLIPPAQAVQELTINTTENGTDATFSTFQGKDSLGENIWIGGGGLHSVGSRDYDFFGSKNSAFGFKALTDLTIGYNNSAFGNQALNAVTTGNHNVALGNLALGNLLDGNQNIAIGSLAGLFGPDDKPNSVANDSIYLGFNTKPAKNDETNQIIIGSNTIGSGSNSVTLGNDNILKTILKGNVGIGTTNTNGKSLSIGGSNANHLKIFSIDGSNTGIQLDSSMVGGSWDIQGGFNLFQIKDTNSGGAAPFNISGNKIGIGKTNPSYLLDVAGAGSFSQPVKVGTPIANTDAVTLSYLNSAISAGSVWTTSADNIYNANLGNVGVGTNAPAAKLEVNGGDDNTELRISSAGGSRPTLSLFENATSKLELMYDSGIAYIRTADNLGTGVPMYLGTKNITRLAIDGETGNVGIGTTAPATKLHVAGGARFESTTTLNDGTERLRLSWGLSPLGAIVQAGSGMGMYLGVNNSATTGIFINSSGNVGIGTTTPGAKLQVNGRVYQSGLGSSTFFGYEAGKSDDGSDNQNSAFGHQALYSNTTGSGNTANGVYALYANSTGGNNSAFGNSALHENTTGVNNTANGYGALFANTTGYHNVANGASSLNNNTTGYYNTANGAGSLHANTTGIQNTANGIQSLFWNTTGIDNTANGAYSLFANNTGAGNTANGAYSLHANNTGGGNTAQGSQALYNNTTGGFNTAVGRFAGMLISDGITGRTTGQNGLYLGYNSKASANGTDNEIVIGYNAIGNGSNSVTLGNDSILKTILKGKVGLGTTTPSTAQLVIATSTTSYSFDSNGYLIKNVGTPILATDAANKSYVDSALAVLSPNFIRRAVNDVDATATSTDNMISYTNVSVSRTVTIPATVCSAGKRLTIADESGSLSPTKTITIAPTGGTISGTSTQTIYEPYNNMSIYCSGTGNAWYIY